MKKIKRCHWVTNDELYINYHDSQWGIPVYNDAVLFEFLVLESFQAGLNWLTILKKRENFRIAFDDFNYLKIANYNEDKVQKLLNNAEIIRHRGKIEAMINNAKCFIAIQKEFDSFSNFIWAYVNHKPIQNAFKNPEEMVAKTDLSEKISKDLRKRGFKFLGPTIVYAFMQAVGLTNDHLITCKFYKTNAID